MKVPMPFPCDVPTDTVPGVRFSRSPELEEELSALQSDLEDDGASAPHMEAAIKDLCASGFDVLDVDDGMVMTVRLVQRWTAPTFRSWAVKPVPGLLDNDDRASAAAQTDGVQPGDPYVHIQVRCADGFRYSLFWDGDGYYDGMECEHAREDARAAPEA